MVDKGTLVRQYGLSVREAEFVEEYIREVGGVDDLSIPFVIANIRSALATLDGAFGKTYTYQDMQKTHAYIPDRTDNILLDSMSFYGIKQI